MVGRDYKFFRSSGLEKVSCLSEGVENVVDFLVGCYWASTRLGVDDHLHRRRSELKSRFSFLSVASVGDEEKSSLEFLGTSFVDHVFVVNLPLDRHSRTETMGETPPAKGPSGNLPRTGT